MSNYGGIGDPFMKKIEKKCRKNLKGGDPLGFFNILSVGKLQEIEGGPFGEKKSRNNEKKTVRDHLISSGIVCYAGNFFGSVPWANGTILRLLKIFVELLG